MTTSTRAHTRLLTFLCVVALSSTVMLWMLWHFPLVTAIGAVGVLSTLGVSGRLAQPIDC